LKEFLTLSNSKEFLTLSNTAFGCHKLEIIFEQNYSFSNSKEFLILSNQLDQHANFGIS